MAHLKHAILAAILPLVVLAGCKLGPPATPRETFARTQDTFIASLTLLNQAQAAGVLDADDMKRVVPYIIAIDRLFDAYDAATKAGLEGDGLLAQIKAALEAIAPYLEAAQEGLNDAPGGNH